MHYDIIKNINSGKYKYHCYSRKVYQGALVRAELTGFEIKYKHFLVLSLSPIDALKELTSEGK